MYNEKARSSFLCYRLLYLYFIILGKKQEFYGNLDIFDFIRSNILISKSRKLLLSTRGLLGTGSELNELARYTSGESQHAERLLGIHLVDPFSVGSL